MEVDDYQSLIFYMLLGFFAAIVLGLTFFFYPFMRILSGKSYFNVYEREILYDV